MTSVLLGKGSSGKGIVLVSVLFLLLSQPSSGQELTISLPTVSVSPTGKSARSLTATEAAIQTSTAMLATSSQAATYRRIEVPIDSIRDVVAEAGRRWLIMAQKDVIRGIQIDPSGRVGVYAKDDNYAKTQIAARLATPGLSLSDRAFTLRTAVEAFTDIHKPERLSIAENYATQLNALGDSAAVWQFEALRTLLSAYYVMGRSTDVVRHGTSALKRISIMPFVYRQIFYSSNDVYGAITEAVSAQPDAQNKIDVFNQLIRTSAIPSPQLVSFDSAYYFLGKSYQRSAERWISGNAKVGTRASPLTGHYWLNNNVPQVKNVGNRLDGTTITKQVNDGKIRIIELGHTSCGPCIAGMYALERLKSRYPSVEPVMLTWTVGNISNRLTDSDEEVDALRAFFIDKAKLTYPIAIWAGEKMTNADGGLTPLPPAYLDKDYPYIEKPTIYLVDGSGMIRRIFTAYNRDIEMQIRQTIEFLLREVVDGRVTATHSSFRGEARPSSGILP